MAETLNNIQQIQQRIYELRTALQTQAPGYESLLFHIHKQLAADEEMTHLLSEEEIGIIVAALSKKKDVIISVELAKKRAAGVTSSGKKVRDLSLEDL